MPYSQKKMRISSNFIYEIITLWKRAKGIKNTGTAWFCLIITRFLAPTFTRYKCYSNVYCLSKLLQLTDS